MGGVLFPGVELSFNALPAGAALLSRVDMAPPRTILGQRVLWNSFSPGFLRFRLPWSKGSRAKLKDEVGQATVVDGGLAPIIVPATKGIDYYEPWLTLYGLRNHYHRNRSDG